VSERTLTAERTQVRTGAGSGGRSRLALPVILTCQLMLVLDVTVMNVALPHIRHDLGFTPTGLSWVINAYALVYGGLLLLGGRAGDLIGRRRLFIAGIVLFTAASLVGGFAQTAGWLLAARVAQGVGAAAAGPNTLALLTTTYTEPRARMRALAVFSGVSTGGFAIGLILGGLLTEWTTWRSVLFINVPFGIAAALLARRVVPEPARHPARLDLPGAVLGTAGVAAVVYAFIRAAAGGWRDGLTVAVLVGGVLLVGAFVLVEARSRQPLMPLRLFRDRNRAAAYLNFFVGPMAMMSMFFFLTQYLQNVDGLRPLPTGLAFLPMAAAMFGMTRLIPVLLPRLGPKVMAIGGAALMIVGLAWLTRLTPHTGYVPGLLGPLLLMGIGGGLGFGPLNVLIMSTVPPADAGAAGGVLQTLQQVGGALGLAVLVTVFGTGSRHAAQHGAGGVGALVAGMTDAFTTSALLAAATLLVALTFRRTLGGVLGGGLSGGSGR
jgi:EmrB/QacA subfamily drug resistance transporter